MLLIGKTFCLCWLALLYSKCVEFREVGFDDQQNDHSASHEEQDL